MKERANKYFRYFTYIRPLKRLPIIRTYGTTIFTIVVLTVFVLFAIKPTVETILILQKKLEDSNQVLAKLNEKGENLSLGKAAYENMDALIKTRIQSAIPDTAELKTIIQTLEGAAKKYEASVSALQIEPNTLDVKVEGKIGTISEISFIFNAEGNYQNLISILQDLQNSSRLVSTETVTLTKVGEGTGLIMSITGKAWYLK